MKPRNFKVLWLMLLASLSGPVVNANPAPSGGIPPSPFAEGTKAVQLTPEQIQDLSAYIDQSQSALEQALSDAKGVTLAEASRIYLDAVKAVVLASDAAHPRSELLMRVILNQALALTYGIPTADGTGVEREGVLSRTSYRDLLPAILKQSIKLALDYVDQDRQAAKQGVLMDLPYAEVAQKRMLMAGQWMRSVLEQQLAACFGIEALQQWLNTMMAEDQQHQAKFAVEIKMVAQALAQAAALGRNTSLKPAIIAGEQERLARIAMRKVTAKMEKDIGPVVVPSGSTGGVGGQAPVSGSLGMSWQFIGAGHFKMGSLSSESGRYDDESQHEVTITRGFEMQTTDVTQAQWVEVMGANPSNFKARENCPNNFREEKGIAMCPQHPVEQVSWSDTQDFIARLNARQHDGYTYRLPTESEWEYAARAGTSTAYSFGEGEPSLPQYGWYNGNAGGQTHDVATLAKNPWGLYDMHGNVWQWVSDWYQASYDTSVTQNPTGPSSGSYRVVRGGCWSSAARGARSANRGAGSPAFRRSFLGFRLVRTP